MDGKRITRDELHMRMAFLMAQRGTCDRLQVGAVLVKDKRVIATSYNGPPVGLPHCSEHVCDITKPCTHAIHAEANLIAFCAKQGISTIDSMLYVTHSPCIKCAELIIQSGIRAIIFGEKFRDDAGINLLRKAGLRVYDMDSSYIKVEYMPDNFRVSEARV